MFQIIIGCILANILTIVIIGAILYFVYKKNKSRIEALDTKVDSRIQDVKNKVSAVMKVVERIDDLLNKVNKK